MLNPKYFNKQLYYINHFDPDDYCDYCDEYRECRFKQKECPLLQQDKAKHRLIEYVEFDLEKVEKPKEYILFDSANIISIQIGRRDNTFKEWRRERSEQKAEH